MKLKKVLAVLLVLCMAAGMLAGCGDKEEDKKKKNKAPEIVKGSMEDMLEAIGKVNAGTLRVEQKLSGTIGGTSVTDITFDREAGEYAAHVRTVTKVDGETKSEVEADYLVIKDNKLYFNLEAAGTAALTLTNTVFDGGESLEDIYKFIDEKLKGWFVFPLPDGWEKAVDKFFDESLRVELIKAIVSSVAPQGEDGDYTVKFATKDDYKALLTKTKEFTDKNGKSLITGLQKNLETLGGIDINAYVSELADFYTGDLKEIAKEYGEEFGFTESQLMDIVKEVKQQDVAALWKQLLKNAAADVDLTSDSAAEMIAGKIPELFAELLEKFEAADAEMPNLTMRVAADDTAYTVTVKVDGAEDVNADLTYRLIPGEAKVKAPTDTIGLKSIFELMVPSYLRYVNKSRAASDAMSLSDIMTCAVKVGVDPEYNIPAGSKFTIRLDRGQISLEITGKEGEGADFGEATKEWAYMCDVDYFKFRDNNLKVSEGSIVGTLQMNGGLTWELVDANGAMKNFFEDSKSIFASYNIKQ